MVPINSISLKWLQENHYPDATEIVSVIADYPEWEQDAQFEIRINFRTKEDSKIYYTLEGPEIPDFWDYVVSFLPEPQEG